MKTETFYTYELVDNCNGFDEYDKFIECKADLIYTLDEQSRYNYFANKHKVYIFEKVKRVYDSEDETIYIEYYDILFRSSVDEWRNNVIKRFELEGLNENESTN